MRYRICPNCKSNASKIINASTGTSTCEVCNHVESLEGLLNTFKSKKVNEDNKQIPRLL